MRLSHLSENFDRSIPDREIAGLTSDSRETQRGWLFAALPGGKNDGRNYIEEATAKGAVAVLSLPGTKVPYGISLIPSENPRRELSLMAAKFYENQPEVVVAVTGTNGKTSTVHYVRQIWLSLGLKAASMGTIGIRGPGVDRDATLTTPEPVALHALLADISGHGITHMAMEASSHGLSQHRLDGVKLKAAGFTNLTHDHFDYHGTWEEYMAAKMRLFDILPRKETAVLNADIREFNDLRYHCGERNVNVLSYGRKGKDIRVINITPQEQGQRTVFDFLGKKHDLILPLTGEFQVMNALCALGLAYAGTGGKQIRELAEALPNLSAPPGRLQPVTGHPAGASVYVDYAHTPDALENILRALRPFTKGRLVCLFGCGGDRDPKKRPLMGKIADTLADLVIVTDDNPRSEDPAKIRAAIMGATTKAQEIGNRREAIRQAIRELKADDVLVIAGKGHERGQIFADRTEPFDDAEEAQKAIEELKT